MFFTSACRLLALAPLLALASTPAWCSSRIGSLIAHNTRERGGATAIERVQGIQFDLQLIEDGNTLDLRYIAERTGRMRVDVSHEGKRVFSEGYDGSHGWEWPGDASKALPASAKAEAALRHGVELPGKLFGLHELRGRRAKVEWVRDERVDGIDYAVIAVQLPDGFRTEFYENTRTGLLTRQREQRPLHPDVDPTPITVETRDEDFRHIAGLRFPFHSQTIDLDHGKLLQDVMVKKITLNPRFDGDAFAMPR
jgi:hypothetical protein